MKIFKKYAEHLDALLDHIDWGERFAENEVQVNNSLNGEAGEVLRRLASPSRMRKVGAFFTGADLADQSVRPLRKLRGLTQCPVYDPTCGAGDLLLSWADALPITPNLQSTIEVWENLIVGHDVWDEFLRVAKRRLVLKAIARGSRLKRGKPLNIDKTFHELKKGDALKQTFGKEVRTILMNPPFGMADSRNDCEWSSGNVSLAALLFDSCVTQAANDTRIVAILPEVLRSGSRYEVWRQQVGGRFDVRRMTSYGRFDSHADVDVFILEGTVVSRNVNPISWWASECSTRGKVNDLFNVTVGAVVPHRDPHEGQWAPFVTSRSLAPWTETQSVRTRRRFKGTKVQPPFVAVRRTSAPRDSERAIGAIVLGSESVAVENHLIILRPHDGTLAACRRLMKNLRHHRTRSWLNERIRCRHLTVGIVGELPLWEDIE